MSDYPGKIIELVAIEKINEKTNLIIKLFYEFEAEWFWEIDNETAENLLALTEFEGNHQYRLSLHTTFDIIKQKYISSITRTFRDSSERFYFVCSEEYKNDLNSIKNAQSINHINPLPFLSANLPSIAEQNMGQINEVFIPKRYRFPFKWISVAMISFVLVILFGYSNNSYLKRIPIKNTAIPKAEAETSVVSKNNMIPPVSAMENDVSNERILPYIEPKDPISYSLPEGYVSLTFDDGPSKYTLKIVDILKRDNVGGTFFFIGSNVKKHPDFVRYVQSNGYSIGSHSMNHVKMSGLSYEKQKDEFFQSSKAIEEITNEKVVLLRPPYGALNEQTIDIVNDFQGKMILWNRDPNDWKTHDANKIFNYVRNTEASGSIILLHESQTVIDALPKIIEHLQNQELNIVSLN
jgi:peptidoglycan-N-acetylglucosamine deacetylase